MTSTYLERCLNGSYFHVPWEVPEWLMLPHTLRDAWVAHTLTYPERCLSCSWGPWVPLPAAPGCSESTVTPGWAGDLHGSHAPPFCSQMYSYRASTECWKQSTWQLITAQSLWAEFLIFLSWCSEHWFWGKKWTFVPNKKRFRTIKNAIVVKLLSVFFECVRAEWGSLS